MPFMRNRKDGVAAPVKSLHQMLGHDSGSLHPCPVERLDHMMMNVNSGSKKGKSGGIKINGNMGDQKTKVFLPPVKQPKPKSGKKH